MNDHPEELHAMPPPSGFRLSPQQRHLWSLQQAEPGEAWRPRCVLLLEGALDVPRLTQAATDVLSRHEVLRTEYLLLPGTGTAVQVPREVPATVLELLDGSSTSEEELEAQLDARPGPVFRLARLAPHRHLLAIHLPALSVDHRTLGSLARELGQAYAARLQGSALPTPDAQYADVAEVFNQLLEAEDTEAGRKHWLGQDLPRLSTAALPFERPSASGRAFELQRTLLPLAPERVAAVEAAAASAGVTSGTFLLACWQLLLSRLSGQPGWTVAVHHDGRTYEGLDEVPGLFERALPLSGEPLEHASFLDLLRDVDQARREAAEWQDYFDFARSPRGFPFGFVELAWPEPVHAGGLVLTTTRMEARITRFDLELACLRGDGTLALSLHHDASRYRAEDIRRLLERFDTLLAGATAHPEQAPEALPLVGAEELRVLAGFNPPEHEDAADRCIHELFEEQARRTPDRTAVVFEDERLSYSELAERASRLASYLRALGVGPETRVGLCLERSVEMMVGVLGILGAGGAYVPLDPMNPRERLTSILEQAGVQVVVTRSSLRPVLPPGTARVVCLDSEAEAIAREPAAPPARSARPDNLAYVLFTSGSTGRPKGVMIPHRSVLNLARALERAVYAGLPSGLRVSVAAPLAFDASVKQWIQLLQGHELHIVPEEVRPDAARLGDWLRRHALDVLDCTPSQLGPLLARGLGREPDLTPARVLVGGEAIEARTWAELSRSERTRFVNLYGPTECTVDATAYEVDGASGPSIGRPLHNMRVYLLDRSLRPVPLGMPGELFIGGAGVARGYVGQPALTAERFLPDPFGPPGSRLYRTGDLGRYREDGCIEFLGRADHQVKLRGFRIELGEIEELLQRHPGVGETAVVLRQPASGEPHLAAYFVPREAAEEGLAAKVRAFLRELLPEYMVPSVLVPLARMPLNRNGKLDRSALPEPHTARPEAAPYIAPESPLERTIAAIWQEALGVEKVGLHGNFFDLGGYSLLMVRVHEKLSAALGRRVSMVELFQHPTVAALARHLAQGGAGAAAPRSEELDERVRRQRQAQQQQAQLMKAGRGKKS
ncbi:amino acid adenylation domain-containing protein [Pyxidicoccus parkwayensis]|uniref:Amino acid adenylation domain-containing protein n=1 Tax=Pyxidicoccus parkwayensis TaxID=2813578 RepID=A0ABX7P4C7_9BACT|nr:non-ribosomal peptide synthetase [Pyxidicoccus parkwaysis]QSQ25342.1 amino acid adenylation domain-containing protein [Pyxidicoccus parkwaysis]